MNDLEGIAYDAVRHSSNVTYAEWRNGLKPGYGIAWRDIIGGYVVLALIVAGTCLIEVHRPVHHVLIGLASSMLTGFVLAYLALFIHEAGHYNLHPTKATNDALATVFLGVLFGIDIKSYRKIHWEHHANLGTPKDTENSYFNALTAGFFFETFTGIYLLRVMFKKNAGSGLSDRMKRNSLLMLMVGGVVNLALVLGLAYLRRWTAAAAWMGASLIVFPFFATIRQILEHRDEAANRGIDYRQQAHGKVSRLFSSGPLSRLIGGAGFNKHMIHHWDPQIPYARLGEIEKFLFESEATRDLIRNSRTTYFKTFRRLLFK